MPTQYRQGAGTIGELPECAARYGKRVLLLVTGSGYNRLDKTWLSRWDDLGLSAHFLTFGGECSNAEIGRIGQETSEHRADVIVGIGGGKLLDAAKSAAYRLGLPVIIVPTVASSDAPCSALSVIYDDEGRVVQLETHPHNPELVLVDTEIILRAPLRYFAAGMGDALATGPEALACLHGGGKTILGRYPTQLGTAAAVLCDRILASDGVQALQDAERGLLTGAFERVVEANTLLSGIGFESGGLAAAHSLHDGLTELAECHHLLHGEKVGFCTAVQAVLLGQTGEAERFLQFCRSIGLPFSLAGVGLDTEGKELRARLTLAARRALQPEETIHSMGKAYTAANLVDAFTETDQISKALFA
ncbi:hypothetical protein VN24_05760 [Paenibacillus beijingensis]|uniref:Glycerol dehydrogenase n=2 Tax=Paenibacillus beijingensis TaxID=1126833 RepID=A0A0D5NGD7_9BACL|nr:hypothetical protein VN24_05760 [Paenibacillus beijingensis]